MSLIKVEGSVNTETSSDTEAEENCNGTTAVNA